jgi:hypothetical protein
MSDAYDSEDCNLFAEALEQAWRIFLKTGRLTSANIDLVKPALTLAIFETAQTGERNVRRLAVGAVARMAKFEDKLKLARSAVLASRRRSA